MHFIYNAKVSPSERAYETVNDTPSAITFSWEFTTTPVDLAAIGLEPSAGIVVSKAELADPAKWEELQKLVYGDEATEPSLPSIEEIVALLEPVTP